MYPTTTKATTPQKVTAFFFDCRLVHQESGFNHDMQNTTIDLVMSVTRGAFKCATNHLFQKFGQDAQNETTTKKNDWFVANIWVGQCMMHIVHAIHKTSTFPHNNNTNACLFKKPTDVVSSTLVKCHANYFILLLLISFVLTDRKNVLGLHQRLRKIIFCTYRNE